MDAFVSNAGLVLRVAGYIALPFFVLPLVVLAFPKLAAPCARVVARVLDSISGAALRIAIGAALAIIAIQLTAVLLRYVFGLSFSWLNDSVIFTFAMIFMLGAAATLRDDGHVRVDILRSGFSARTKASIELIGAYAFIFPICLLILYSGAGMITRTWVGLEPFNESDGLPIKYLFKTLVPLFAILLAGQGLAQALKAALGLRGRRPLEDDEPMQAGAV